MDVLDNYIKAYILCDIHTLQLLSVPMCTEYVSNYTCLFLGSFLYLLVIFDDSYNIINSMRNKFLLVLCMSFSFCAQFNRHSINHVSYFWPLTCPQLAT